MSSAVAPVFAFSGRADLKLAGDWKQTDDVEAWSEAIRRAQAG